MICSKSQPIGSCKLQNRRRRLGLPEARANLERLPECRRLVIADTLAQFRKLSRHDLLNDRVNIGGKPPRIGLPSGRAAFRNVGEVGFAQALSAPLGGRQSGLGALRDHLPLVLGNGGQDMHRQPRPFRGKRRRVNVRSARR